LRKFSTADGDPVLAAPHPALAYNLPTMHRNDLLACLDKLLEPGRFKDYCPNGLQVEGREQVSTLVTGVTASLALLEAAADAGADAVLVHHGYFWKDEDPRITGSRRARLSFLLSHGLNLFAYHLPLDAHPELGNNAQLARRLGLHVDGQTGNQDLLWHGRPQQAVSLGEFAGQVARALDRAPLVIGDPDLRLKRIAWCTGGAQGYFEAATLLGVDGFVTGEISEQQVHLSREAGVAFIAAGHHATERYGVQAVGAHLAAMHGLVHHHIEIENPV